MQYFEIAYYRTYSWIDKRYVSTEWGASDAIRKSRAKKIVEVTEITKEQYIEYSAKKKANEAARKQRMQEMFIAY